MFRPSLGHPQALKESRSTVQLIDDLADIPYNQKLRLASFDISNMYIHIPTE
jgi:hypothetical protein